MSGLDTIAAVSRPAVTNGLIRRPSFRLSDIWKAPLHDFPIRDEILYQYLPLSPDMDVLEIGPGSGFTAFRLASQVRSLTLLDVAAGSIDHLKGTLGHLHNLNFRAADVCAPHLAASLDARFDAVLAIEVFEYVPSLRDCLKNLAAVLHPGGHLLAQFPNYAHLRDSGRTCYRTRTELDEQMRAAGFRHWAVYALRLRPYAGLLFRAFHEGPMAVLRRLRTGGSQARELTYDQMWAFRKRSKIEKYKSLLHGAWTVLSAGIRLGGDCFERTPLQEDILNRNLLLIAER